MDGLYGPLLLFGWFQFIVLACAAATILRRLDFDAIDANSFLGHATTNVLGFAVPLGLAAFVGPLAWSPETTLGYIGSVCFTVTILALAYLMFRVLPLVAEQDRAKARSDGLVINPVGGVTLFYCCCTFVFGLALFSRLLVWPLWQPDASFDTSLVMSVEEVEEEIEHDSDIVQPLIPLADGEPFEGRGGDTPEGAGFAGGTQRGKVRFIRLEYVGGDWDQGFGVNGDMNMLLEYGLRTKHVTADRTESRTVAQLKNFSAGESPPFVYLTGQGNISLSNSDLKILRKYLLDKHGMIFCDNGGSGHFHNQFLELMNKVLPGVRPVSVPLDDVIHRVPFHICFLPYVAPHGGKEALGWYLDGRWVCYYHPGDICDAWRDGHAGVNPKIAEACYQLGTNVIFYAHTEHSKWLEAGTPRRNVPGSLESPPRNGALPTPGR